VALKGTNSSIVMQPDSEFFNYLRGAGLDGTSPEGSAPSAAGEAGSAPVAP
jgi:modulator of FtsH protease HflC